ncbi:MAG: carbohydrate kinase family protein [Myxococcales bacterium]|nr:MAG: carbohydrate kinase family protein [Myxococcales bacterium]
MIFDATQLWGVFCVIETAKEKAGDPGSTMLVAGEGFEDWIFLGLPSWPGPGQEFKTDALVRVPGGGAVITSAWLAHLGRPPRLISALSPDSASVMKELGVELTNLRMADEKSAVTVVLSTAEDRSFLTYNGVNAHLEERLLYALREASVQEVLGSYLHLALEPHEIGSWIALLKELRGKACRVSWDAGYSESLAKHPELLALMREVDVLFINHDEALLYSKQNTIEQAQAFWQTLGCEVVIKQGKNGALYLSAQVSVHAPAPAIEAKDTTGAGDAFNAGFLFARQNGKSPQECLALGNELGARAASRIGGMPPLPSDS